MSTLGASHSLRLTAQAGAARRGPIAGRLTLVAEDGFPFVPAPITAQALDSVLTDTPDLLEVVVTGAVPGTAITFSLDGTVVYTDTADSMGDLDSTPIAVDERPAGDYVLEVSDGIYTVEVPFTVLEDAELPIDPPGTDAAPAVVPGTTGVRKWVLQDPAPGGLGSWQMPINPSVLEGDEVSRELTPGRTSYVGGRHRISEGSAAPHDWTLTGFISTQEEHDKLLAYAELNRRIWLIDHRDRAWKVTISGLELTPRLRTNVSVSRAPSTLTDWAHDYQLGVSVFTDRWEALS